MMKLTFDISQVAKDISVIKFHIVNHKCTRAIMNKLRALIEKCSVILIRFDDEEIRFTKARRRVKIDRHSAAKNSIC